MLGHRVWGGIVIADCTLRMQLINKATVCCLSDTPSEMPDYMFKNTDRTIQITLKERGTYEKESNNNDGTWLHVYAVNNGYGGW